MREKIGADIAVTLFHTQGIGKLLASHRLNEQDRQHVSL